MWTLNICQNQENTLPSQLWLPSKLSIADSLREVFLRWTRQSLFIIHSKDSDRLFPRWVASIVAQLVKSLPTMWETLVRSLVQEDPLEKKMETLSSILAWKIPWMEELVRLQSMGSQRVGHDWATSLTHSYFSPKKIRNIKQTSFREVTHLLYLKYLPK